MNNIKIKNEYKKFNEYFSNLNNLTTKEYDFFLKIYQKIITKLIYKKINRLNSITKKIVE